MKLFEALTLVEDALEDWDERWGDSDSDSWSMGLRTRFKFLTHMLMDLKKTIMNEGDIPETLAMIAAICIYWIMSDYHYKPDEPELEQSTSKEGQGGYL